MQMKMRARHAELEPMLARSIARDLGAGPGDIRPLLVAASVTAAFMSVRDQLSRPNWAASPSRTTRRWRSWMR